MFTRMTVTVASGLFHSLFVVSFLLDEVTAAHPTNIFSQSVSYFSNLLRNLFFSPPEEPKVEEAEETDDGEEECAHDEEIDVDSHVSEEELKGTDNAPAEVAIKAVTLSTPDTDVAITPPTVSSTRGQPAPSSSIPHGTGPQSSTIASPKTADVRRVPSKLLEDNEFPVPGEFIPLLNGVSCCFIVLL